MIYCKKCIHYAVCDGDADKSERCLFFAEEPKQGEWKWCEGDGKTCTDGWICTSCGHGFHTKVPYFREYNFCPNCGAKMKEGEAE